MAEFPGPGTHDLLPSGPEGALAWCSLDQMYCGGTNLAGQQIICTCCARVMSAGEPATGGTVPPGTPGTDGDMAPEFPPGSDAGADEHAAGSGTGAPAQLPGDGQGDPALSDPPVGGARPGQTVTTPEQAQATDPAAATPPDPAWG